jgi:hypothetical protein
MKLSGQQRSRTCWMEVALTAGGLLAGQPTLWASVQEEKAGAPPAVVQTPASSETATTRPEPQSKKPEAPVCATAVYSPNIQEMLKLADAKVSADVLKSFVEHSTITCQPSAAEIIALKERGVTDEVITVLMNRGAQIQAQASSTRARVAMPTIVRDLSTGGHLDPESYDFWYYHYAYPRALSYSYETLPPYYPPYVGRFSLPHRHGSRFDRHRF